METYQNPIAVLKEKPCNYTGRVKELEARIKKVDERIAEDKILSTSPNVDHASRDRYVSEQAYLGNTRIALEREVTSLVEAEQNFAKFSETLDGIYELRTVARDLKKLNLEPLPYQADKLGVLETTLMILKDLIVTNRYVSQKHKDAVDSVYKSTMGIKEQKPTTPVEATIETVVDPQEAVKTQTNLKVHSA